MNTRVLPVTLAARLKTALWLLATRCLGAFRWQASFLLLLLLVCVSPRSEAKQVGVFYSNWFSFPTAWTPQGGCTWGEPALGWYQSEDTRVIDQHTEWLAGAGTDFVIFDWSNNCRNADGNRSQNGDLWAIEDKSYAFAMRQVWRKQHGMRYLKVAIFLGTCGHCGNATNGVLRAKADSIKRQYLDNPELRNIYWEYQGKPYLGVFALTCEQQVRQFSHSAFTVIPISVGQHGNEFWNWEVDTNPGYSIRNGRPETMTVMAAIRGTGSAAGVVPQYPGGLPGWRNDGSVFGHASVGRRNGQTFRDLWQRAINANVDIVLVQSFNEWTGCEWNPGEEMNQEFSNDIEPMRGGHGDLYIRILGEMTARFKGTGNTGGNSDNTGGDTSSRNPVFDSRVFNAAYYHSRHPDLQRAFNGDEAALRNHWERNGIREGRQAHQSFHAPTYVNRYPDLKAAFGSDYRAAIEHYLRSGIGEGRSGNPGGTGAPSGIVAGKTYRVLSQHSGKAMDVSGVSNHDGARIHQWDYLGASNQQWIARDASNGRFSLVARHSNKCLDVPGWSRNNGEGLIQYSCNGGANQQWQFRSKGQNLYEIVNAHSGKCLDVREFSRENGGMIHQWDCHGGPNQLWRVEALN